MENEMNTQNSPAAARSETGMGATIGILVIILILATGGVYLWTSKQASAPTIGENQTTQAESADEKTQALMHVSSSDSASSIEADLNATDIGDASGELLVQ
jgi:flagellar basal body-associated protein FliL